MNEVRVDQVPLIVLGADIDGLSAALALAHQGFPVHVLERGARNAATPDAAVLTPAAVQELAVLGLGDHVVATSAEPAEITHADGRTGAVLRKISMGNAVRERYGHPYLTVRRSDLRALLVAACDSDEMIDVRYGSGIAGVEDLGEAVLVTAADGHRYRAEALVAADGASSPVRPLLGGGHATSVPFEVRSAPGPPVVGPPTMRMWSSETLLVVQMPVGAHASQVALVSRGSPEDVRERDAVVTRELAAHHPEVRAMAAHATESEPIRVMRHHAPLDRWTRHRITVLGGAAAPMLPHAALGAPTALVDAGALGAAFDRADGRILHALEGYARSRAGAWVRTAERSHEFALLCHAEGLLRRVRDLLWSGTPVDALAATVELPAAN